MLVLSTHVSNQPLFQTQNHFGGVSFNTQLHIRAGERETVLQGVIHSLGMLCKKFVLYNHF